MMRSRKSRQIEGYCSHSRWVALPGSIAEIRASMKLFADKVIPHFRKRRARRKKPLPAESFGG